MSETIQRLREAGLKPTLQRIAIAQFVLATDTHPSAEEVLAHVRRTHPTVSRATVYNTLNAMADKGLLTQRLLREGSVLFDSRPGPHHHIVDPDTGKVYDVPWEALEVSGITSLSNFEILDYQVVLRGRIRRE